MRTVEDVFPPLHRQLRAATRGEHDAVDAAFGGFDLGDREAYCRFLTAHATVLPAVESALDPAELLPAWQGRTEALRADLADLDTPMPALATVSVPHGAARWGALYVVEGSRLGGVHLSQRVAPGLPTRYLSAGHGPGQWKSLLGVMDDAAEGALWRDQAIAGARAVFAAYADAAARVNDDGR